MDVGSLEDCSFIVTILLNDTSSVDLSITSSSNSFNEDDEKDEDSLNMLDFSSSSLSSWINSLIS